jgi:hypothetical protein
MKVSLKISVLLFLLAYAGSSTAATANKSHNRYDACDESMCVSSGDSSKDDAQKNASTGFDCYSLKRVSCKAAIVYIYAIVVYIGRYCVSNFALKNFAEEPSTATITLDFAISLIISTGIPLFYITYACVIIWWKNLMPNMSGRLRELVVRFLFLSFCVASTDLLYSCSYDLLGSII